MKEVKIEYNKILLPFCCGLTAFSNLLQLIMKSLDIWLGCGLTAFSNLLQLTPDSLRGGMMLRLDRIF